MPSPARLQTVAGVEEKDLADSPKSNAREGQRYFTLGAEQSRLKSVDTLSLRLCVPTLMNQSESSP
jgi:hypothetical protein